MTSMRRNDVASTSFRRHVPTRFLTNQCQIITFLILKSDIIENSRIELRGIVLPLPSNRIKVIFIIILPFYLIHLCFFLFHIEIEGKGGWIIGGGGGGKGYVGLPSQMIWGACPPPPLAPLFLRLCIWSFLKAPVLYQYVKFYHAVLPQTSRLVDRNSPLLKE